MNVSAQAGSTAYLNCRISLLQDKTVSDVTRAYPMWCGRPSSSARNQQHLLFIFSNLLDFILQISVLVLGTFWGEIVCGASGCALFACGWPTRIWHLNLRVHDRICTLMTDAIFTVPELISTSIMAMTVPCWCSLSLSLSLSAFFTLAGWLTGVVGETRSEQR